MPRSTALIYCLWVMSFIYYSWEKLHDFVDATFPNAVSNHSTILGHRLYTIKQLIYLIQHHSIGTVSQSEADIPCTVNWYEPEWTPPTVASVTSQYKYILQPVSQSGQFLVQKLLVHRTHSRHEIVINPVADLGGANAPPLWRLVMYFCVHNCTSPSNDYAAVACSNNNQAQFTHVSVPYWSPDVWLGLELLWDIQFGLTSILNNSLASYQSVATRITCHECINVTRSGCGNPKNFRVYFVCQWLNPPF